MLGQFSPERPFQQLLLELLEKPFFAQQILRAAISSQQLLDNLVPDRLSHGMSLLPYTVAHDSYLHKISDTLGQRAVALRDIAADRLRGDSVRRAQRLGEPAGALQQALGLLRHV